MYVCSGMWLSSQVSGGVAGQHGVGGKHCPQCSSEGKCVHDGSVHRPEDTAVSGWEAGQLQVTGQGHRGRLHAGPGLAERPAQVLQTS